MTFLIIVGLVVLMGLSIAGFVAYRAKAEKRRSTLKKEGAINVSNDRELKGSETMMMLSITVFIVAFCATIYFAITSLLHDEIRPVELISSDEIQFDEINQPGFEQGDTLFLSAKEEELNRKQKIAQRVQGISFSINQLAKKIEDKKMNREVTFYPDLDDPDYSGFIKIDNAFLEAQVDVNRSSKELNKPDLSRIDWEGYNDFLKKNVLKSETFTADDLKNLSLSYLKDVKADLEVVLFRLRY